MMQKSAIDAIQNISNGQNIFLHGLAATPHNLIALLLEHASTLSDITVVHLHTFGDAPWAGPQYPQIKVRNYFCGQSLRKYLDYNRIDHIPCFLSEVPTIFRSGKQRIDVGFFHISAPNSAGKVSFGTTVEVARAAFDVCKIAIAQINPQMPFIAGDGVLDLNEFDAILEVNDEIPQHLRKPPSQAESTIGNYISEMVEDGSTLQIGIGGLPDAVLSKLKSHRHLGIHSEMWSDGVLELIECGAVDNSRKKIQPGKTLSSFVIGSEKLYRFCHNNADLLQKEVSWINDLNHISANPKAVAINSAIEVDMTGQVCSDSIGTRIISGFGGQVDFMRGAALSEGGKPIIALTSRTSKGLPRIVPTLKQGAGVVTSRAHIRYVVTEYGIADLYARSLHERAQALTAIAHPEDRDFLKSEWARLWKIAG
jgi:acyl-CoA hydrolase